MRMIRYILGCVLLLSSLYGKAQYSLYIDPHAFDSLANRPYQLNNGNAINTPAASLILTNQSGTAVVDTICFGYTVSSGGVTHSYSSDTTVSSGIYYPYTAISLAPQGNATISSLIFHFTSPVFVVGSSIVVIWPIVRGHNAQVDSATVVFTITAPDGIAEQMTIAQRVYMDGSQLVIRNAENDIGSIRIYDLSGQLMLTEEVTGNLRIPMQQYADGIYTVETVGTRGDRHTYKVLKQ